MSVLPWPAPPLARYRVVTQLEHDTWMVKLATDADPLTCDDLYLFDHPLPVQRRTAVFNVDDLKLTTAFTPRADNMLVLPLAKAGSSFIVEVGENREQPEKGIVLAVGPGGIGTETGRTIPMTSRRGEVVCYGKFAGLAWEIAGPEGEAFPKPVKVFILRDAEVLLAAPSETMSFVIHDGDPRKMHEEGQTCEDCPSFIAEQRAREEAARLLLPVLDAPEVAEESSALIAQERERLRQERTAREVTERQADPPQAEPFGLAFPAAVAGGE